MKDRILILPTAYWLRQKMPVCGIFTKFAVILACLAGFSQNLKKKGESKNGIWKRKQILWRTKGVLQDNLQQLRQGSNCPIQTGRHKASVLQRLLCKKKE